jgi:hypothetical protein
MGWYRPSSIVYRQRGLQLMQDHSIGAMALAGLGA